MSTAGDVMGHDLSVTHYWDIFATQPVSRIAASICYICLVSTVA